MHEIYTQGSYKLQKIYKSPDMKASSSNKFSTTSIKTQDDGNFASKEAVPSHLHLTQATESISSLADLYSSSLLAHCSRRSINAGSSSSNCTSCLACRKIWGKKKINIAAGQPHKKQLQETWVFKLCELYDTNHHIPMPWKWTYSGAQPWTTTYIIFLMGQILAPWWIRWRTQR